MPRPSANLAPLASDAMGSEPTPHRFALAGLLIALNLAVGLNFFSVAPVLPLIMDSYHINRGTASLLIGVVILLSAAMAIPSSLLASRLGFKRVFTAGWLLAGAGVLAPLAGNFYILLALRVALGLSLGILFPLTATLLMQWFRPKEMPLINSLLLAFHALGITVSMLGTALLAEAVGWRGAVSLAASVVLVGAGPWLLWGRFPAKVTTPGPRLTVRTVWQTMRSRTTLLLALADSGAFVQYAALTAWLPTYYNEVRGMSLEKAGFISGLLPLAGIFGVILGGLAPVLLGKRRLFLIIPGALIGCAGFGTFLLGDGVLLYGAVVLMGIGSWVYLPSLLTIPLELPGMTPDRASVVWAMVMSVGGVLGFASPLVVGALADATGSYVPGLAIWAVLAWSLVVAGVLLPETGPGRVGKERQVLRQAADG